MNQDNQIFKCLFNICVNCGKKYCVTCSEHEPKEEFCSWECYWDYWAKFDRQMWENNLKSIVEDLKKQYKNLKNKT